MLRMSLTMDTEANAPEEVAMVTVQGDQKKSRKRLKRLCGQIREQMEFYFSDANLHKDRFLKKEIDRTTDGYLDLSLFSKFNKLRALTDDMKLVAKALSTSNLIEVSEDKEKIRRQRPLSTPQDTDSRTVYVECLPPSANHDWVKTTFDPCGKVLYVSLPKYQSTGDIKGFGFVEFDTKEEAAKACEMLNNPPAHVADCLGRFPRDNKQLKQLERQIHKQKLDIGDTRDPRLQKLSKRQRTCSESAVTDDAHQHLKRQRSISQGSDSQVSSVSEPREAKRRKTISESASSDSKRTESSSSEVEIKTEDKKVMSEKDQKTDDRRAASDTELHTPARKRKHGSDSETEPSGTTRSPKKVRISTEIECQVSQKTEPECPKTQAKKTRNRKRNKKKKVLKDINTKSEIPELRVIPKSEWLSLRKEYLKLQKSSMHQLKTALKKNHDSHTKRPDIQFSPGAVVKVTAQEVLSRKEVKEYGSKLCRIEYVDIPDGATEGYIRCHSGEEASKLKDSASDLYTFTVIEGQEEENYWNKLKADREHKLSNKSKNKKRGRDKIFKKAEQAQESNTTTQQQQPRKHVIFEDD